MELSENFSNKNKETTCSICHGEHAAFECPLTKNKTEFLASEKIEKEIVNPEIICDICGEGHKTINHDLFAKKENLN